MFRFVLSFVCFFVFGCASDKGTAPAPTSLPAVVTLEGVDFMGGDLKHLKTPAGASACSKACADNKRCNAYTYAQPSHANAKKHNSCWLKKGGFKYKKANHYTSGIKP